MSLPYLDRLDRERQNVFNKLKPFSNRFILAGGTAIMVQIGHRLSFDFDCFSEKPLAKTLPRQTKEILGMTVSPFIKTSDLCLLKTKSGIEIHFVFHPYKNLRKPHVTSSLPVAHLDDLAANKANVIGRRGAWRDYVDLFFFLKWKLYTIGKIIELANQKFEGEFNDKLFLEQLTYFSDLDITPTIFLQESYTPLEIKALLEKEVGAYVKERLRI
ncbi:MAG: hypothetical protein ACD_50C00232G0001 [uncultured bacterium]|nr:MAG: hypothetical protein ACD_50C00232G0001 [uncultured bacterium]